MLTPRNTTRVRSPGFRLPKKGFTLIEVLVVVVILAVLAGTLLVAVPQFDQRRAVREAERLSALLALVCEQAELSGRDIGVHLAADGYGFSLADRDEGWLPFGPGHRFHPRQVSGVELRLADRELPAQAELARSEPQALCWPSGELSALDVRMVHASNQQARVMTGADAQAQVEVSDDGRDWRPLR